MIKGNNTKQNNNIQILKINRSNQFTFFDEDSLIKLKLSLYTTLAGIEEEIVGREINKLFDRLIPNSNDQFKVNLLMAKEYYEKYYQNCPNDISGMKLLEDVKSSLDSIINKNYNMEFPFHQTYIEELCKVLVYSYLELSNKDYFGISHNKSYKISNQKEFIKAVDKIVDRNVDVIKRYRDRDRIDHTMISTKVKQSISSNSTRSSFSSGSTYTYQYSSNPNEFEIPNEMIILINKFQTIKTLKLSVPNKVEDMTTFIIILLNMEWLFPNLFEVVLNFSMGPLHKELYDHFVINSKINNISNNISSKTASRKSLINTNLTYLDVIKSFRNNFELLVVYSYFISKMQKLKILNLIFPESFQNETIETLKFSDVYLINFQFLNFFTPISELYQFSVDFNSLDTSSFEKVLSLFHKNNNLKSFKISLFTDESHYTTDALVKLCHILNLNISQFYSKKKSFTNSIYESNEYNNEIEEFILGKLLDSYEENLEKFFFIFQTKMNIYEFHLKADLPRVISNNENYILTLHKFLFNIFNLLNNENSSLQTLKINLPFLSFDNRKYPGICKFFEIIDLKYKQSRIYNFTILLHFNKVYNINNIISTNLKFLHIGDLDFDTLQSFFKYFNDDENYRKKSNLTCIEICLSNILFDAKKVLNELKIFLTKNKPNNLREFSLKSNLLCSKDDFSNLFKIINNDRVEKYNFEFNKKCEKEYLNFNNIKGKNNSEVYFRLENRKLNLRIIKLLYKLSKDKKNLLSNKNIFENIQRFLEIYEKKILNISFRQ